MGRFKNFSAVALDIIHEENASESDEEQEIIEDDDDEREARKWLSPTEQRDEEIKDHLNHMLLHSSLHGLRYICDEKHSVRRVFWLAITVAAFAFTIQKVYESTRHYFDRPYVTSRARRYVDKLVFPAVSFCNLNDLRLSVISGTSLDLALLQQDSSLTNASEYRRIAQAARHHLEDMLVDCSFLGQPCSWQNFTDFSWSQGDQCFTFNSGSKAPEALSVTGSGVRRSLLLTINIQHYEYYRDLSRSGVHLMIHSQDETPVKIQGPLIPPGFTTYIEIDKQKLISLPTPYKTNCGSKHLRFFSHYSRHLCWLESLTDYVVRHCGCKDFFMPGNYTVCEADVLARCLWPNWGDFDKYRYYECPTPCEEEVFTFTMSRSLYPSREHALRIADRMRKLTKTKSRFGSISNTVAYMRDNLLRVVLYYGDLSYELVEQKPSYGWGVWFGDVGGQICLFLGASLMTYLEFVDWVGVIAYTKFFQKFVQFPSYQDV